MSKENPYLRKLNPVNPHVPGTVVTTYSPMFDVYSIIEGFNVTNPGLQHALKKILTAGQRGTEKNVCDDIRESIQSLRRALQIEEAKINVPGEFPKETQTAFKVTEFKVNVEPEINKEAFLRP